MSALTEWFANPVIKVKIEDSDEVERLKTRYSQMELEMLRLQALYVQECNRSMMLEDVLREHGIKWR